MKLTKIITIINQNEISKFYKILTTIISELGEKAALEKSTDAEHFVKTFKKQEVSNNYKKHMLNEISNDLILDLISDILVRDGNLIMSRDWFNNLVDIEIKNLKNKIKEFKIIPDEEAEKIFDAERLRSYRIYYSCVKTAFENDIEKGQSQKITNEELSILNTLRKELDLSNEDARAIYFLVVDEKILNNVNIDDWIEKICVSGIGFYRKTEMKLYIPEEFLYLLREIKGKRIADKNARRILKSLDDKIINKIKRKYGIKATDRTEKIEEIIRNGVDIESVLREDIYEKEMPVGEKKKTLHEIIEKKLEIHLEKTGRTLDERLYYLFEYFNENEKDINIGMSKDGFDRLISSLKTFDKTFTKHTKKMFELEDKTDLTADILTDYNIKPKDILYLLSIDVLKEFCKTNNISYRGKNIVNAIISSFSSTDSLLVENYILLGNNDINGLKNNGVDIKSEMVGIEFENATKKILQKMNFNVDETLRKEINTKREKADIVIKINDEDIIIGECKSSKNNYSSFSSLIRQLKSYHNFYSKKGFNVKGCIIFAGVFTDDFISESVLFTDFNLTLWQADTLYNVFEEYNKTANGGFPINLFIRQGLISEDVTIKALKKQNT